MGLTYLETETSPPPCREIPVKMGDKSIWDKEIPVSEHLIGYIDQGVIDSKIPPRSLFKGPLPSPSLLEALY